ncbi:MAG: bifunctional DNA-binding transcriptional regulator/O6-methylguanine-DNA methyltransferase Ada [Pigmentiphaga sp.]|nr:bifunctional DNA-binding transcriptional regulator/O6-methylguanine-DNA methyltransferase Ada [Pigmentiphaga sp.]
MSAIQAGAAEPTPQAAYCTAESRWRALLARDPRAHGHFVYAVRTTGVYAWPGAAGRLPKRENVEFFDSPTAAEAAGYRPSRRRAGDAGRQGRARRELVALACRHIEAAEAPPSLGALAARAGLSPYHFHRVFKAETGLTPKAYASAYRARRLRQALGAPEGSITTAIYESGFNASSRFYEVSDQRLGMTASEFRAGGAGASIRFAVGQCALGAILVARSGRGICAILLGDDAEALVRELQDMFPQADLLGGDAEFEQWMAQVVGFVEAPAIGLALPLDVRGTAFQERVWQALREIPVGATVSYTELAARIGAPAAVRAVASACAANRLAVAIPCHRVVRRDGDLAGYRWGVERKREILRREASAAGQTKTPPS